MPDDPKSAWKPVDPALSAWTPVKEDHPDAISRFGTGLYDSTIGAIGHAVQHPIDTALAIGEQAVPHVPSVDKLRQVYDLIHSGEHEKARKAVANLMIESHPATQTAAAVAAPIVQDVGEGNYAGAAGHAVGDAAMALLPKAISPVAGALGEVSPGIRGAMSEGYAALRTPEVTFPSGAGAVIGHQIAGPQGAAIGGAIGAAPGVVRAAIRGFGEGMEGPRTPPPPPPRPPVKAPPLQGSSLERQMAAEKAAEAAKPKVKPPPLQGSSEARRMAAEKSASAEPAPPTSQDALMEDLANAISPGKKFADLTPQQQANIRSSFAPKESAPAPNPNFAEPDIGPPSTPGKTPAQLIQEELAARRAAAAPQVAPTATPVVDPSSPLANNPKAMAAAQALASEVKSPQSVNQWNAEDFKTSRQPFKAMELAQPLHEVGITSQSLESLGGKPSPLLQQAVKSLGLNQTGEISPQVLQMTIDELKKLEKIAKPSGKKTPLSDIMK